jgi:serine/threonine protein kinase
MLVIGSRVVAMPSPRLRSAQAHGPSPLLLRKLVGRYRIQQELGRGGMGVVYRAFDLQEDREVAVKMLSSRVGDDLVAILRFKREARTASSLSHPAI